MRRYEKSLEVRERVAAARLAVPEGLMTQVALALQQGLYYIFFPVLVIAPPFQLAVRLLIHSDFKLLLLPFKALWWLGAGFLVTVSLVWMGRSLWRWLLLLPGLLSNDLIQPGRPRLQRLGTREPRVAAARIPGPGPGPPARAVQPRGR